MRVPDANDETSSSPDGLAKNDANDSRWTANSLNGQDKSAVAPTLEGSSR
jgi:hypothetical protein